MEGEINNNPKEENKKDSEEQDLIDDKEYWEKVKTNLINLKEKEEINLENILDQNYPFFEKMQKYYEEEYNDFIEIFPSLKTLLLEGEENKYNLIKILHSNEKNSKNTFTRKQVAYIFALGFLNISTPIDNKILNSFDFESILKSGKSSTLFQFGRCFLNYLINIGDLIKEKNNKILSEKISYIRDCIEDKKLINEIFPLCELQIMEGSMYDTTASYIVDFANKYIGGGTLHGGCVQEEILFAIQPELCCSLAFMEVMSDNDAIRIDNTILYCKHKGYGGSFSFDGNNFEDEKEKRHRILVMDANVGSFSQFNIDNILRDIHKAYVCFNLINLDDNENGKFNKNIATGNWGCGVFGGDHELKFIQQWIAASFANVEKLEYYTFNCKEMAEISKKFLKLRKEYKTANNLYRAITGDYGFERKKVLEILFEKDVINASKDESIDVMI